MVQQGSGNSAELEIGDNITIVFEDDGDPDKWGVIDVYVDGDNVYNNRGPTYHDKYGDAVAEAKERMAEQTGDDDDGSVSPNGLSPYGRDPFKCSGCNKTWPAKLDQTPTQSESICPDCYDDD